MCVSSQTITRMPAYHSLNSHPASHYPPRTKRTLATHWRPQDNGSFLSANLDSIECSSCTVSPSLPTAQRSLPPGPIKFAISKEQAFLNAYQVMREPRQGRHSRQSAKPEIMYIVDTFDYWNLLQDPVSVSWTEFPLLLYSLGACFWATVIKIDVLFQRFLALRLTLHGKSIFPRVVNIESHLLPILSKPPCLWTTTRHFLASILD